MSGTKAWALTADGDEVQTCHPSCRDKISGILDHVHVGLSLFPLSPFDASFAMTTTSSITWFIRGRFPWVFPAYGLSCVLPSFQLRIDFVFAGPVTSFVKSHHT